VKHAAKLSFVNTYAKDVCGTALIEMSLLLLPLTALMVGAVEYGRVFQQFHVANKGVTAASRYLARQSAADLCPAEVWPDSVSERDAQDLAQRGKLERGSAAATATHVLKDWTNPDDVVVEVICADNPPNGMSGLPSFRGPIGSKAIPIITVSTSFTYNLLGLFGLIDKDGVQITASHTEVFKNSIIRHWKDQSGSTLVEFSLLLSFLLFSTFGIVEGGYIFYQYNGAQKATQIAARYAATRPPVANITNDCFVSGTPTAGLGTDCAALAGVTFEKIECEYINIGSDCDADNFLPIRDRMKSAFPFIEDDNIFITYEGTGLGYIGRGKAVPSITVELKNIQYSYIVIGNLMKWQGSDIGTT